MQFLAQHLLQSQGDELTQLLKIKLSGWEKARPYAEIRASMLTHGDFCPREVALLDVTKQTPKDKYVGVSQRVTFDQGTAIHEMIRNKWLVDHVVGDWRCTVCGHQKNFETKPKLPCHKCGKYAWRYEEIRVNDTKDGISGGLDSLFFFEGHTKAKIVELKSMDKDQFKSLKAPLAEHRQRTILYMHLAKMSEQPFAQYINIEKAKVLYVSKAFGVKTDAGFSPFKEYNVDYALDEISTIVSRAKRLDDFRKGIKGMPPGICPNSFHNRVKSCACPKACWSGAYPSQD